MGTQDEFATEYGIFALLVFATNNKMAKECKRYHSQLAQLIAIKKGEHYSKTISCIRTRISLCTIDLCSFVLDPIGQ